MAASEKGERWLLKQQRRADRKLAAQVAAAVAEDAREAWAEEKRLQAAHKDFLVVQARVAAEQRKEQELEQRWGQSRIEREHIRAERAAYLAQFKIEAEEHRRLAAERRAKQATEAEQIAWEWDERKRQWDAESAQWLQERKEFLARKEERKWRIIDGEEK